MPSTMLNKFPYPAFDKKPYYDDIVALYGKLDVSIYQLKTRSNSFVCGGGVKTWNPSSTLLSWTDDFKITMIMSGFLINVEYGPDAANRLAIVPDGSFLYVRLPTVINDNLTRNFAISSQWAVEDESLFAVAYNCENILYFRNGTIMS